MPLSSTRISHYFAAAALLLVGACNAERGIDSGLVADIDAFQRDPSTCSSGHTLLGDCASPSEHVGFLTEQQLTLPQYCDAPQAAPSIGFELLPGATYNDSFETGLPSNFVIDYSYKASAQIDGGCGDGSKSYGNAIVFLYGSDGRTYGVGAHHIVDEVRWHVWEADGTLEKKRIRRVNLPTGVESNILVEVDGCSVTFEYSALPGQKFTRVLPEGVSIIGASVGAKNAPVTVLNAKLWVPCDCEDAGGLPVEPACFNEDDHPFTYLAGDYYNGRIELGYPPMSLEDVVVPSLVEPDAFGGYRLTDGLKESSLNYVSLDAGYESSQLVLSETLSGQVISTIVQGTGLHRDRNPFTRVNAMRAVTKFDSEGREYFDWDTMFQMAPEQLNPLMSSRAENYNAGLGCGISITHGGRSSFNSNDLSMHVVEPTSLASISNTLFGTTLPSPYVRWDIEAGEWQNEAQARPFEQYNYSMTLDGGYYANGTKEGAGFTTLTPGFKLGASSGYFDEAGAFAIKTGADVTVPIGPDVDIFADNRTVSSRTRESSVHTFAVLEVRPRKWLIIYAGAVADAELNDLGEFFDVFEDIQAVGGIKIEFTYP